MRPHNFARLTPIRQATLTPSPKSFATSIGCQKRVSRANDLGEGGLKVALSSKSIFLIDVAVSAN